MCNLFYFLVRGARQKKKGNVREREGTKEVLWTLKNKLGV